MMPVSAAFAAPLTVASVRAIALSSGCPDWSSAANVTGMIAKRKAGSTASWTMKGQISEQFWAWLARNWVMSAPGGGIAALTWSPPRV